MFEKVGASLFWVAVGCVRCAGLAVGRVSVVVRVIYYNALSEGHIWLLIAYAKAKFDNLPTAFLNQLKEEISNGS
ncbi:hypothetical protein M1D99_25845 [Pseudomonas sp. R3-41]